MSSCKVTTGTANCWDEDHRDELDDGKVGDEAERWEIGVVTACLFFQYDVYKGSVPAWQYVSDILDLPELVLGQHLHSHCEWHSVTMEVIYQQGVSMNGQCKTLKFKTTAY